MINRNLTRKTIISSHNLKFKFTGNSESVTVTVNFKLPGRPVNGGRAVWRRRWWHLYSESESESAAAATTVTGLTAFEASEVQSTCQ